MKRVASLGKNWEGEKFSDLRVEARLVLWQQHFTYDAMPRQ